MAPRLESIRETRRCWGSRILGGKLFSRPTGGIGTTPIVMEGRMTLRSDRMTVRLIVAMVTAGTLIASRGALAQQPPDAPVDAVETAMPAQIALPDGASSNAS